MWALDRPYAPRAERLLADTPLAVLAVLAVGAAVAMLLVEVAMLPPHAARIIGVTAGHGALFATALAWAHVSPVSSVVAIALLALAATASVVAASGSTAYLAPVLWIFWLAARGQLDRLGLGTPVSLRTVVAGALVGAGLSSHLLVSASRTLGVQVRVDHVSEILSAIAYDLGANVLAAECFFRGALFNRAARRWSFATAATMATAAYVLRYLVDPLLPKSTELVAGAVFYLALLGAINCWLLAWSQSLVPGLVSATLFFAAYRTLGPR
jgi:uncharacterized membrane protein